MLCSKIFLRVFFLTAEKNEHHRPTRPALMNVLIMQPCVMIKHRQPEDIKYLFKKAEREYPYKAVSDTSTGNVVFSQSEM